MGHRGSLGLALGGGGLRGAAHLGVLQVLARQGIRPQAMTGSSAGSIVAALWASGWSIEQMVRLALRVRPQDVFEGWRWVQMSAAAMDFLGLRGLTGAPVPGLIPGDLFQDRLRSWTNNLTLRDIDTPIAIVATDIDSGRPVVFTPPSHAASVTRSMPDCYCEYEAPLAVAVRASCSVPGLFEPVTWNGHTLVDGAATHCVPIQPLRALGTDVRVAVDVCDEKLAAPRGFWSLPTHVLEVVNRTVNQAEVSAHAHQTIRPLVAGISFSQMDRIPAIISSGRRAAEDGLPALKELLTITEAVSGPAIQAAVQELAQLPAAAGLATPAPHSSLPGGTR
ncbi:MAG: patatin-like phospholipase family protein [Thermaerobacterales bacterium]